MMKEWHIKNKIIAFAGRLRPKNPRIDAMERERVTAIIANRVCGELNMKTIELENYMIEFIHHVIKEELK